MSHLKSILFGSALAISSQASLANKPLPCPTSSPLVDTIGVVQGATKQKVEDRLRLIETQKHHQLVIFTVDNFSEYGFGSIEEMANSLGKDCKIGFRGENTGIIILYTKSPSLYRIENAATERYITDAHSKRIIGHSKSPEVCKKEDVTCRLDDITSSIDSLIRKEFPDAKSVDTLREATRVVDAKKADQDISDLFNILGIGGAIALIVGGGVAGGMKISRLRGRNRLKKEILELSISFAKEKLKYPDWFWENHIRRAELAMKTLESLTDGELDMITKGNSRYALRDYERNTTLIKEALERLEREFREIEQKIKEKKTDMGNKSKALELQEKALLDERFIFNKSSIPVFEEGDNPDQTISFLDNAIFQLDDEILRISHIRGFYTETKNTGAQLQKDFTEKRAQFSALKPKYLGIYNELKAPNIDEIEKGVHSFSEEFKKAHEEKNIPRIEKLWDKKDSIISSLVSTLNSMNQSIEWYNGIPGKIEKKQQYLANLRLDSGHEKNARSYIQKTGKKQFSVYNPQSEIANMQGILSSIKELHSKKENLKQIDAKFMDFTQREEKMTEYLGLGVLLAKILRDEAEEIARAERRAKEEADRKARQEADDRAEASRKTNDDYNPGGGGGWSGAGATDD